MKTELRPRGVYFRVGNGQSYPKAPVLTSRQCVNFSFGFKQKCLLLLFSLCNSGI